MTPLGGITYTFLAHAAAQQGSVLNLLKKAIDDWQADAGLVYVSGIPTSRYNILSFLPVANGHGNTHINIGHSIRQNCTIKSFTIDVYDFKAGAVWAFKIFRYDSVEGKYKCVFSYDFTPATAHAVNTVSLSTTFDALEGDCPGIYMTPDNYNRITMGSLDARSHPLPVYQLDSNTAVNGFLTISGQISGNGHINLSTYSNRPYAVFLGDSIFGGGNGTVANDRWHTDQENYSGIHTPGGSPGDKNNSVPYRLSTRMPENFKYQNFAKGGSKFSDVVADNAQLASAVLAQPKAVFIHCGVNDVAVGRTWAAISANLDTIKAAFPAGTKFYLNEVNGWQCSDAQGAATRALNANFATYCTANGWTLIPCHDEMSMLRQSTGQLDDLATAYNMYSLPDSVHLNTTGVDKLAEIMYRYAKVA